MCPRRAIPRKKTNNLWKGKTIMHSLTKNHTRFVQAVAILITLALLAFAPGAASANFQTFDTIVTGVDSAGDAVKAEATFTTGDGTITITLQNLIVNQTDVGQNVSDLLFNVSGSPTNAMITSSSALTRTVANDGTGSYTDSATASSTGWVLGSTAGSPIHLNGLAATYTPTHTLIGLPDPVTNTYSNANSSITGTLHSDSHQPFIRNTATFTLSVTGVTADTTISGVQFSFGTTAGDDVGSTGGGVITNVTTPAPSSALLLGIGSLGLVGFVGLRRWRQATAAA
jgi:hypothetical protein